MSKCDNSESHFKTKRSAPMRKQFSAYCKRQGLGTSPTADADKWRWEQTNPLTKFRFLWHNLPPEPFEPFELGANLLIWGLAHYVSTSEVKKKARLLNYTRLQIL